MLCPAGTASVTRGVTTYVDNLLGHKIAHFFNDTVPLHVPTLAPYPDFFSFGLIAVMTALLAFGVKESSIVNNILTFLNLGTAATAVIAGIYYCECSSPLPHSKTKNQNLTDFCSETDSKKICFQAYQTK